MDEETKDILRDIFWAMRGTNYGGGEQYIGIGDSLLNIAVTLQEISATLHELVLTRGSNNRYVSPHRKGLERRARQAERSREKAQSVGILKTIEETDAEQKPVQWGEYIKQLKDNQERTNNNEQ